jgi:hypothetical protein
MINRQGDGFSVVLPIRLKLFFLVHKSMLYSLYLAVKFCHINLKNTGMPVLFSSILRKTHQLFGATIMSKEQKSNKEDKKKPALNPKEKKAAKKSKKDSKN